MNKYEIMFIVKPDVEEEARNTLIENFKSILTANGGSVDNVNEWGLRDFAYEIKDYTKGYYVMVGRMTRDPELRRTGNGAAVTSFTLALNRNYNSADGQQADYISCVVWNKVAENVAQYCAKGSLVGVEGRLRSRSYDNAQGQRVYVTEVVCDSVQFLETRAQRERNQSSMNQGMMNNQYSQPAQPQTDNFQDMQTVELEKDFDNSFNIMEDDIQF